MPKALLFVCLLLFLTRYAFGQAKQDRELSKKLDQLIAARYPTIAPGCVVLVAKNGQIIYNKSFGSANLELTVPMRPDMVFRMGSITKQYTAVAILQLVEQGKISLQDSLQRIIKDFPHKGSTVTIENLLTHTSGLVDYEVLDFHIPNAIRIDFPPKQLIDSLSRLPLDFKPSTRFSYSNSNYLLLGYIIEQVSGKPYKDYLEQFILNPAGLLNTYYDMPNRIIKNRVNGYAKDSTTYRNAGYISMSQVFSAGALAASPEDLLKWHQALYAYKLVKRETLEKAITAFKLADGSSSPYGYGWFINDWRGSKSIGHGGAIDGFRSMETYFPDQDIFIVTMFNADNDEYVSLSENVADLVMGKSMTMAYKDLKLPVSALDGYVGTYVSKDLQYATDSIKIYREGDRLFCDLSNKSGLHMGLFAQSHTLFYIPVIKRVPTTIEFTIEDGKVKGAYWTQQKRNELRKVD